MNPDDMSARDIKSIIGGMSSFDLDITEDDVAELFATSVLAHRAAWYWADAATSVKYVLKRGDQVVERDDPSAAARMVYAPDFRGVLKRKILSEMFWGHDLVMKERYLLSDQIGLRWLSPRIYMERTNPQHGLYGFDVYRHTTNREPIQTGHIPVGDAWYTHGISFDNDFDGVAPAEVAYLYASSETHAAKSLLSTFRNGMVPAAIVQPAKDIPAKPNQETISKVMAWLKRTLQGAANAGKTLVSEGRWEWIQLQPVWRDMALEHINPTIQTMVPMAFKIPAEFLITGQARHDELDAKIVMWRRDTLKPFCEDKADSFTEQVLHAEFGDEYHLEADLSDMLPEDQQEKMVLVKEKVSATILTLYDAQVEMNAKPDESLRDLYMVQGIPVPRNELSNLWRYHFKGETPDPGPMLPAPTEEQLSEAPDSQPRGEAFEDEPDTFHAPQVSDRDELATWQRIAKDSKSRNKALRFQTFNIDAETEAAIKLALRVIPGDDEYTDAVKSVFDRAFAGTLLDPFRELAAWKARDHKSTFEPESLPQHVVAFVQDRLTDTTDIDALFAQAAERLAMKAIQSRKQDYEKFIQDILTEARGKRLNKDRFVTLLRAETRRYIGLAYMDGLIDGGVLDASMDDEDKAKVKALQQAQNTYIRNLANSVYETTISDAQAAQKPVLWFQASIYPAYLEGLASAKRNQMMEWVLGPAEEHCKDCPKLNGQRHRLKDWMRKGLYPKSGVTECNLGCKCSLIPAEGRAIGNYLGRARSRKSLDEPHHHEHGEACDHDADQHIA